VRLERLRFPGDWLLAGAGLAVSVPEFPERSKVIRFSDGSCLTAADAGLKSAIGKESSRKAAIWNSEGTPAAFEMESDGFIMALLIQFI